MAKDLKIWIDLEVNKIDDWQVKKQANKVWKEIWENLNSWMSSAFAKWMAIWDTIKAWIQQVWNMTKQFVSDSINLAKSYESAFAWVRKTVDWTESDFKRLDTALRKMSTSIPIKYEELAKVMELWWQLWVNINNLDKFTETVSELWVATNLTSESAAQMLAQFANITKMDLNDIDRLGAVIVDLWNNFATTEADIVNFAQRIAGAWQIAGISQANIMGIATAFSSVGIEAEAWGTAVQKVLLDINGAVNTWWDKLKQYADLLWMTVDEFKELYKTNPEKVFEWFVKSLGTAWEKAQLLLSELWLDDQRLIRWFLSLAQNSDLLTDAITRSNTAWEENVALVHEAEQRFQTVESQMIMLQNERANLMEQLWEKLKWTALLWEEIKTQVLETMAWLMWISPNSSSLIDDLKWKTVELDKEIKNLKSDLQSWRITLDEYMEATWKLEEQKAKLNEQIEENQKKIDDLTKSIKFEKAQIELQREEYERLNKKFWENSEYTKSQKKFLEDLIKTELKHESELDALINPVEKNTEVITSLTNATWELKVANDTVLESEKAFNEYKVDWAKTRAEFDKQKAKAIELAEAYLKALEFQQALLWQSIANDWNTKWKPRVWDILALWETTKKINELKKKMVDLKNLTFQVNKDLWWWGWSWWSKKTKSKKEELEALRDLELKAVMESEDTEEHKYQRYLEIYDDYKNKIVDAEWKTYDEMYKTAKEYLDKKEDKYKEEIKYYEDIQWVAEDVNEAIKDHTDSVKKLGDEWWNVKNKAKDSLREVKNQLKELDEDYEKDIISLYNETKAKVLEWKKDSKLAYIWERVSLKDLMDWQYPTINWIDIDKAIEYKKQVMDLAEFEKTLTDEQKKQAEQEEKLTKLWELRLQHEKERAVLVEKSKVYEAVANSWDFLENAKVRYKDESKEIVQYFDDEKQQWTDITDFKNSEYARDILNTQEQLQTKKKILDDELKTEIDSYIEQTKKIKNEYETDEKNYKAILDKKKEDFRQYVSEMNSIASWLNSTASQHNAYWGSILNWNASWVWENGPEQIIARQSSYVQPRNAVNNNSTVYNNQSSLNINGLEIGNFNTIDDLLNELRNRLTYRN